MRFAMNKAQSWIFRTASDQISGFGLGYSERFVPSQRELLSAYAAHNTPRQQQTTAFAVKYADEEYWGRNTGATRVCFRKKTLIRPLPIPSLWLL